MCVGGKDIISKLQMLMVRTKYIYGAVNLLGGFSIREDSTSEINAIRL